VLKEYVKGGTLEINLLETGLTEERQKGGKVRNAWGRTWPSFDKEDAHLGGGTEGKRGKGDSEAKGKRKKGEN